MKEYEQPLWKVIHQEPNLVFSRKQKADIRGRIISYLLRKKGRY